MNRHINEANDALKKGEWMSDMQQWYFLKNYFQFHKFCPTCQTRLIQAGQFQMYQVIDDDLGFRFKLPLGKGCFKVAEWYNRK